MARRGSDFWDDDVDPDEDGEEQFDPPSHFGYLSERSDALGRSFGQSARHPNHPIGFPIELLDAPHVPAELARWAEQRGLSNALSRPATELVWWLGWRVPESLLSYATVRQCLLGRGAGLSKALQGQFSAALAEAARNHIRYLDHRARLEEARRSLWARAVPAPLTTLAQALRRRQEQLAAAPECQGPVDVIGAHLLAGDHPPLVTAVFPERWNGGQARIGFAGHAEGRLSLACNCQQQPQCRHQRVLLELLLDAIHGETALGAELAEIVAVPSWQRLLGAFGAAPSGPSSAQRERLLWRLGRTPQGLLVQPVVQVQNARGHWSPGRKLAPDAAIEWRRRGSSEDRAALDAFVVSEHLRHFCGPAAAQLRLLEALLDHPRLSALEPPYEPLRLKKAPAAVAAALNGNAELEIGLAIGDQRIATEQLPGVLLDERWGVLFAPGQVSLFELPSSVSRLLQSINEYGIALPPEAHERAAELLSGLSQQIAVELPEALRGRLVPARSTLVLRLVPLGERRLEAELRVRSLSEAGDGLGGRQRFGADQLPGEGPLELFGRVGDERVRVRREFEREATSARALAERLGLSAEPGAGPRWQLDGEAALELVHRARSLAAAPEPELVVEWPASEAWQTRSVSLGHLRVKLDRLGDWFGIGGSLEVDELEASLAALLAAVRSGQRFIELGPGRFARIEAELALAASRIDDLAHTHGGTLLLGRASAAALSSLELPHLEGVAEWQALWSRIAAASQIDPEPPSSLRAELRPYQRDGFRWLARLSAWDAGACLADDMGLGKTVQCLAVLLSRSGPHLVVAPTSVGPNWMREAQTFAPALRTRLYRGPERTALLSDLAPDDLLVTSYDLLAIDIEALGEVEFDTLVLDEAQAVKNARTQRARAACALRARFKLALTGTPVENHLGELWSIFSIVSPSLLGPWEHFRDRFAAPIERDGDRPRLQALSRLMRPFLLRRTKADVAPELPSRTSVIEPIELSSRERALYEVARREALSELNKLAGDERARIQILAALTRLRRIACHPRLVAESYRGRSSKLETLLRLVDELRASGQRALVFSQFTSFLALVREALDAKGIQHLYLDGQTKLSERSALVDAWRDNTADFFLLSLKAGGSGLNLIGADAVIHLDPWWNPAVEDQATDRTHRIGQQRPVTAIRLIAQGTIEEAVLGLHEGKRSLADGLLEGTEAAGKLSSTELVDLIRFGEGTLLEDSESCDSEDGSGANSTPEEPDASGTAAIGLDVEELRRLRDRLGQRLQREDLLETTVRAYLRSFEKLIEFAQRAGGRRSLEGWREACLAAVQAGQLAAPQNLALQLSAVIRRAAGLSV